MNKVILMGRLTKNPDIRYSQGANETAVARYTLAVDRRFGKKSVARAPRPQAPRAPRTEMEGEQNADFIPCVAFGKSAEFAEKYFHQGIKIAVTGRIQTGSYTNRDGVKVYTTDVIIEDQEFAESKAASPGHGNGNGQRDDAFDDGFMKMPDNINGELPFL